MSLASPSLSDLVDEVLGELSGWTIGQEQVTSLNGAITDVALTITVDDAAQISAGPIEIDSELLWVTNVDRTNNIVTIAPWGRGYRDTTPATHADNAMVVSHPRFPRQAVKKAIQQALFAVYPDLYQVKVDATNTIVPTQIAYPLPADCDVVLSVACTVPGPSKELVPVRRWRFDAKSDQVNGKGISIFSGLSPGQTLRVTYAAIPTQLVNETDLLSVTGLLDSVRDVLVYGACYRLVPALEAARLQQGSVEQSNRSSVVPTGAAMQASRYFEALYEQALSREVLRLQKLYKTQSHLER